MSLNWRICLCVRLILLPFIVPPSVSTGCSLCLTAPRLRRATRPITAENDYRVTVAVAGFAEEELSIESKENTLTIKGSKQAKQENADVLY